jgi:hypothetical protein
MKLAELSLLVFRDLLSNAYAQELGVTFLDQRFQQCT